MCCVADALPLRELERKPERFFIRMHHHQPAADPAGHLVAAAGDPVQGTRSSDEMSYTPGAAGHARGRRGGAGGSARSWCGSRAPCSRSWCGSRAPCSRTGSARLTFLKLLLDQNRVTSSTRPFTMKAGGSSIHTEGGSDTARLA